MNTATFEERLTRIEHEFDELKHEVLGHKPRAKSWRQTVGMIPDDELSRSAEASLTMHAAPSADASHWREGSAGEPAATSLATDSGTKMRPTCGNQPRWPDFPSRISGDASMIQYSVTGKFLGELFVSCLHCGDLESTAAQ